MGDNQHPLFSPRGKSITAALYSHLGTTHQHDITLLGSTRDCDYKELLPHPEHKFFKIPWDIDFLFSEHIPSTTPVTEAPDTQPLQCVDRLITSSDVLENRSCEQLEHFFSNLNLLSRANSRCAVYFPASAPPKSIISIAEAARTQNNNVVLSYVAEKTCIRFETIHTQQDQSPPKICAPHHAHILTCFNTLNSIEKTVIKASRIHGMGLFATSRIPKDTTLMEFDGQLIDLDRLPYEKITVEEWNALKRRRLLLRPINTAYAYINHSRTPNVEVIGNGVKLISLRNVHAGEEILADYRTEPLPEEYIETTGRFFL